MLGLHNLENVAEPIENLKVIFNHINETHLITFLFFISGVILL